MVILGDGVARGLELAGLYCPGVELSYFSVGGVVVQDSLAFRSWQARWGLVIVEFFFSVFLCLYG